MPCLFGSSAGRPAALPGRSLDLGGGAGLPRNDLAALPSFVGVWLLNEAELAVRGGTGDRTRDDVGDLPGEADMGVGTASEGIADSGGLEDGNGGTAGKGVRERDVVDDTDGAGDRERTGVADLPHAR